MCNYDIAFASSLPSFHHHDVTATTIKTTTICTHPGFIKGVCIACGRDVDDDDDDFQLVSSYNYAVPLDYICEDMRLSREEIARVKIEHTKIFLGQKKLCLVLDLDNTLLHSVSVKNENLDNFRDFLDHPENKSRGELFYVEAVKKVTKLRPFVRTFLKEANTMFKMYIYTRGTRPYANAMAILLDPEGVYFGSRVISREDCTQANQKGLDVVFAQENAVLIIDDKKEVWPDNSKENLIVVEEYDYFSRDVEDAFDEGDDGVLRYFLEILKKIHAKFFTECDQRKLLERDVRQILDFVAGEGCVM